MRIAYLDCGSGISGDMTLGALVDAGVELAPLQEAVRSLGLSGVRLTAVEVERRGFRATQVLVETPPEHAHRHLSHILDLIDRAAMTAPQKDLAGRIFRRLAEAEAKVHGTTVEKVHFHEVGAADSIADVVGTAVGWGQLGVDRVVASPIPTGRGTIRIAHGETSIPAPATAELLCGVPLAESAIEGELTTPTGAAIVTTLAEAFGALPAMQTDRIGCGAGTKDWAERANILRLFVGRTTAADAAGEPVWMLETNLDDVSGEWIGHCADRLWRAGALDVFTTAIQMKKNRPGVMLSVLCRAADLPALEEILFAETGTLGLRRYAVGRRTLSRQLHRVATAFGEVEGKVGWLADQPRFAPEYESCRRLAEARTVPLRVVYEAALRAFRAEEVSRQGDFAGEAR